MFSDLIPAGYTEVDSAFTNEGRDIGGGEKDKGYGVVFYEGDVEASFAAELYVGAGEEIERGLLETSLWSVGREWGDVVGGRRCSLLGTAKRRRPSRLSCGVSFNPTDGSWNGSQTGWDDNGSVSGSTDWLTRSIPCVSPETCHSKGDLILQGPRQENLILLIGQVLVIACCRVLI